MRYNIISRGVGARHCRAPTGVPHANEKRYSIAVVTNVRTVLAQSLEKKGFLLSSGSTLAIR
ncbi:hypothetical protein [Nostoc sp.]|uniref:hypothetical protein n=1 Tax=Nostoc sp. TaxID=1180 RepID=UPI002FFC9B8A